jgi:hypothetical protein
MVREWQRDPQGERERRWILSLHCLCCGTASLITAAVPNPPAISRESAIPSELTLAERHACAQRTPISDEDVLDVHVYLRGFQGDLSSLDF